MAFIQTTPDALGIEPFSTIGGTWFLLTAGTPEAFNTMTCSWGALGEIWNAPSGTAYVRTSRYTHEFLEKDSRFTISVFPEEMRPTLAYCGSHSGRDFDKVKETGLTPVTLDGAVAFEEASIVLVCEKVYAQMLDADAIGDPEILERYYGLDEMHKMYIGRIVAAYRKD